MILEGVFIGETTDKGRGVFTDRAIIAGTLVEQSPVIVMTPEERVFLDQTKLHDYIFEWGDDHTSVCMAMGYVPVFNHAYRSNCEYEMDYEKELIRIYAVRDIEAGEELFINYNGDWDNDKPLWFPAT